MIFISKVYNCIKLLENLKYYGRLSGKELAGLLGVSDRYVKDLVKEIDSGDGIYIDHQRGKRGYELVSGSFLCEFGLDSKELMALEAGKVFLKEENGFYLENEYALAVEKIKQKKDVNFQKPKLGYLSQSKNPNSIEEKENIITIQNAIKNTRKIKIKYFSVNKNKTSKRIVHPYFVYSYAGFWYLAAFCENNNEFRDFKIIRVKGVQVLEENYSVREFNYNKFIKGCFGIVKDEPINVKLKIKMPRSIYVKESVFIDNQEIEELESGDIIYSATMKGKPEIMSWIRSMGSDVEVLEPIELRDEIIKEVENLKKIYLGHK